MRTLALALPVLLSTTALADQCAWVPKSVADLAKDRLRKGETLQEICAPCGEKTARPLVIDNVVVAKTEDPGSFEVKVNGRGLDLAYVYLLDARTKAWQNLGAAVHCGVEKDTKLTLAPGDLAGK